MMKVLAISAILAIVIADAFRPKWHQLDGYTFERYVEDFNRPWVKGTPEWDQRAEIFYTKLKKMQAHNADNSKTWKRGVNHFTDMTAAEWKRYNRAYKSPNRKPPREVHTGESSYGLPLPREVDYRTWTSPRVLTAVKHQGSCGNCWTHSAVETIEAYYALTTGMLPVLSTQQITSCDTMSDGCNGGDATSAYDYVNSTRGLTEEWAYPFVDFFFNISDPNANTTACKNISKEYPKTPYTWFAYLNRAGVAGYGAVTPNNATATMSALATLGPLSISVAAGNWQDYESGVMFNDNTNGGENEWGVDHDVQMVGYGTDKELGNIDYWIVRNSWSTLWGEDGFVRLARPPHEPCSPSQYGPVCGTSGCLNDPHYPFVTKNPPTHF